MNTNTCSTKTECANPETAERARPRTAYRPPVDIVDTPNAVLLVADVPGVSENDVEISMEKNVLTILGKVEPSASEGYSPYSTEYGVGDWERSFTISSEIDRQRVEASVKDGVLRIKLPKALEASSRKIRVTAG